MERLPKLDLELTYGIRVLRVKDGPGKTILRLPREARASENTLPESKIGIVEWTVSAVSVRLGIVGIERSSWDWPAGRAVPLPWQEVSLLEGPGPESEMIRGPSLKRTAAIHSTNVVRVAEVILAEIGEKQVDVGNRGAGR